MDAITNDWKDFFESEQKKKYFPILLSKLKEEEKKYTIYPSPPDIFNAFKLTPLSKIKVVILGQDPYINGEAMGLAFSVKEGYRIPPLLKNIFKEIANEGYECDSSNGDLTRWAKQGVFLLNTTLTVRAGQSNSHKDLGWINFAANAISEINKTDTPKVFMLWGNNARRLRHLITNPDHFILESAHPSPLSANKGFFGNNHFIQANLFLGYDSTVIDWR